MGAFTGLPDFGRPELHGAASGYAAFEQPGLFAVLPAGISPAPVEGSSGPLLVDVYLQERGDQVEEFAIVTTAFVLDLPPDTTSPVARPAPLGEGVARLFGPSALGLPVDRLPPQPFDAAAGRVLPSFLRLDGVAGRLLTGALEAGLLAVGAEVWLTVTGVAARCPGVLTVDAAAVLTALAGSPVQQEDLLQRAADGLPGVTVTSGPADARTTAAAVADRLATRLGAPAWSGWDFSGGADRQTDRQTSLTWDLSAPAPARRLVRLFCDPVVGAHANPGAVRRHTAPPLTDGRERVLVHTTLPALPAGVVVATVALTAPPAPPDRPFEATATGRVTPPAPTEVVLTLSPGEPLVYDLGATAVMESDRGPQALSGPVRRVQGDTTPILTAADLGLRLLPVHAADELLELADVVVTATGRLSGTTVRSEAVLTVGAGGGGAGQGGRWLALPREAEAVTLEVAATTRGTDPVTVRRELPDAAVWLDAYSFEDPPWPLPGAAVPIQVVEAAGLRAVGRPGDPDWRFLPLTAGPSSDATGAPQLSLLEAGPMTMLMVTAALRVSDDQQQDLRTACVSAGAPAGVSLVPAPFEAEEASLLVARDGELVVLVSVTPSGTVTQDAAFSAHLDAADLDTVHRALGGERGLLAVRYLLRVAASGPEAEALTGGADALTVLSDASTWRT